MKRIVWFARGGGIKRCGPFKTQVEAAEAMELVGGGFPADVFVWPEETTTAGKKRKGA